MLVPSLLQIDPLAERSPVEKGASFEGRDLQKDPPLSAELKSPGIEVPS